MKTKLAFLSLIISSQVFGAVNSIQLQIEGNTPNKRETINRLLTDGTALVGDSSNLPQVVDIATQSELNALSSTYQGLDSDLTSIAGLSTTSFGRGLLTESSASTLRSTLGLVIGTNVQAYDLDLDDLADGSLTGTKVGFADTDSNFSATDIQSAIEELDNVNVSGPNAADGKVEWSQLVGVPAGFADGSDDGSGGGSGTLSTLQEAGVQLGGSDIVTLNFNAGFDLAESPDTKISVSLDASEIFTGGDLTWTGNTPSIGANSVALGTDTTGNYVATIADSGSSEITVANSGSESAAVTLAIAASIARDSEVAAGYQPLDSDLTSIAALTTTSFGRGLLDDANAAAGRTSLEVGLTTSGSQNTPTTTNPIAPTWATQDYMLYYGVGGEIDLPAVASYAGKTIGIYITGSYTVTVDPNGSEIIVEAGASLGAGTADSIVGSAGTFVCYTCDGSRWIKLEGGGSSGFPNPATEALNMGGFDITNAATVTATEFVGSISGVSNVPAGEITGTIPDDVNYGKITSSKGLVVATTTIAPTTGSNITVQTGVWENTITLNEGTETVVFDAQPEDGKEFRIRIIPHTSSCTVTWPSTWSFVTGGLRTSFIVPANKPQYITVWRDSTSYKMSGDPHEIAELPEDTTPAITASVAIDQGAGTERATLAKIRDLLGTEFSGSFATPSVDPVISASFDAMTFYHISGDDQEIDLDDATGYGGRTVVVYFDGGSTVTIDPAAGDVIYINGTAMAADEKLIITGTTGQTAFIVSDNANWSTSGGTATYAEETP